MTTGCYQQKNDSNSKRKLQEKIFWTLRIFCNSLIFFLQLTLTELLNPCRPLYQALPDEAICNSIYRRGFRLRFWCCCFSYPLPGQKKTKIEKFLKNIMRKWLLRMIFEFKTKIPFENWILKNSFLFYKIYLIDSIKFKTILWNN